MESLLRCSCGTMILDALFKIKNDQDPSFVFRRFGCAYYV